MAGAAAAPTQEPDTRWRGDGRTGVLVPILCGIAMMIAIPTAVLYAIAPPPLVEATPTKILFRLDASNGGTLASDDLAGRPYLIFFGFTRCPDICPTTLAELSELTAQLKRGNRSVRQVFVSIDPERDTPAVLHDYLSSFGDDVVGLTGSAAQIAAIAAQFGVHYKRVPLAGDDYTMEHTATVFLVDPNARVVLSLPAAREKALAAIRNAVDGAPRPVAYKVKGVVTMQSPMAEFLRAAPSPSAEDAFCSTQSGTTGR